MKTLQELQKAAQELEHAGLTLEEEEKEEEEGEEEQAAAASAGGRARSASSVTGLQ